MKKVLYAALVVGALAIMAGCTTTNENEYLASPGTLTYQVTNDGFAVVLSWDTVSDAEGYYVYLGDAVVDTIEDKDSTSIRVDEIGAYKVTAYKGDLESDPTNIVDLRPVETSNVTIYDANNYSDTTHPSGAGWNSNGDLIVYPLTNHCEVVDFYYYLSSVMGIQLSHTSCPNSQDSTYFLLTSQRYGDADSVTVEPIEPNFQPHVNDVYYVKLVQSNNEIHYAKIKVLNVNDTEHSVTLEGAYQTIPGLKRVGNAAK